MTQEYFHFQRLVSCPGNRLTKKLFKIPLVTFRLGLGKLLGNHILILTTTESRTENIIRTPVEYFFHKGRYYIISGFGEDPGWVKDIQASPLVTLQNGYETLFALARQPQTEEEWHAIRLYLTHSPVGTLLRVNLQDTIDGEDLAEKTKHWPAFTFDPTDQPCPPPLQTDLVWAWPLFLLGAAIKILLLWLISLKD